MKLNGTAAHSRGSSKHFARLCLELFLAESYGSSSKHFARLCWVPSDLASYCPNWKLSLWCKLTWLIMVPTGSFPYGLSADLHFLVQTTSTPKQAGEHLHGCLPSRNSAEAAEGQHTCSPAAIVAGRDGSGASHKRGQLAVSLLAVRHALARACEAAAWGCAHVCFHVYQAYR